MKKSPIHLLATAILTIASCSTNAKKSIIDQVVQDLKIENPKHGFISKLLPTKWEESLISGNGTIGTLMPGNANKDRVVLSHEKLFLPKYAPAPAPKLGSRLNETRKLIFEEKYQDAAKIMMEEGIKSGIKDLVWTNPLIPACQIEIDNLNPIEYNNYARSIDYETGETKIAFSDGETIIHRSAFVSRKDDVAVVKISSPSQSKLSRPGQPLISVSIIWYRTRWR